MKGVSLLSFLISHFSFLIKKMESNFVDYVKIYCRSGKGGRGSMHLRHVKYNPNGGPDGGDGGRGGSVILRGNHNFWTLLHLKYERHIFAEHGGNGGKDKCHGTDGKDVYIDVPCGTVVYNAETGRYVCDVTYDGQEIVLLKGGRGGLGNFQFRSATNQAPRYAQPGEPMQEMTIILELKLLADVGLVGFPNAGKSTLLSSLSNARPKIANYPFTTMEPSLGIVAYRDQQSFVMADIPGIIEGAAEGKGLGLRFLRHIERNSLLLFMVPGDTDDIKREAGCHEVRPAGRRAYRHAARDVARRPALRVHIGGGQSGPRRAEGRAVARAERREQQAGYGHAGRHAGTPRQGHGTLCRGDGRRG